MKKTTVNLPRWIQTLKEEIRRIHEEDQLKKDNQERAIKDP